MRVLLPITTLFCVLAGYSVLRPLRDEIVIRGGLARIPWLFTGTFAATLVLVPAFGWLSARVHRRFVASASYALCALGLLALHASANEIALFIAVSVLNLFVISVFWSLMSDAHASAEARRWYGTIACGGTAGAIAGPALAAMLVRFIGPFNLLLVAAAFLFAASIAAALIARRHITATAAPIGGGMFAGARLALASPRLRRMAVIVICYSTISTLLYFEQASILGRTIADSATRTQYFALLDLIVNVVTVTTQALVTSRVLTRFGLRIALSAVPAAIAAGFAVLTFLPRLGVVAALQILHRTGEFSLTRPAREVIYTGIGAEARYKAKNMIDTLVYRANDAAVAWLAGALGPLAIAVAGTAVAAAWTANGYLLGRSHDSADVTA